MYVIGAYIAYLLITLAATICVAHTLHKNGRVFLVDAFQGNTALADSVNHLLVVGFYLINLGYICFALRTSDFFTDLRGAIEEVSDKVGIVLLVLGAMHFFNLYIFGRVRRRTRGTLNGYPSPVA